jgi:RND family efflux transporter MFP subunit
MRRWFDSGRAWTRFTVIVMGAPALTATLLATACGGDEKGVSRRQDEAIASVSLETASSQEWPETLEATAGLQPFRRAMPGTVLMGRIDQVLHHEGDRVKSGEVLARVESRDVAARLAQAEAGASAARAQEENARRTRDRIRRLFERQAASQKNLDDADAGYEAAAAGLKAAEEGVAAAKVMVGYSQIVAPFAGMVTEKRVETGDTASPGVPLFTLEDTAKMKLDAAVPESWLRRLKPGDPVEVSVEAAGAGVRSGTISEILPAVDPRSRTGSVRVILDNDDGALRSGMFARLRIAGPAQQVVSVPQNALLRRGPLAGIFVVDEGGTARLRWVTVGSARDDRVEVLTGLEAGERLVAAPTASLKDGQKVQVN